MKTIQRFALILLSATAIMSCRNAEKEAQIAEEARLRTIDSLKAVEAAKEAELAKQRTIDSMKAVAAQQQKTVIIRENGNTTTVEQRKGWSGAAKGAVIGAGVGAVTGAVIDKDKPGRGAVIGGLAGGGVGAGTGAIIDSEKKKKAQNK